MSEGEVIAPGRVNLIGEHIDYHGRAVLPMAIGRAIRVRWRARADREIRARAAGYGERRFVWETGLAPWQAGDWGNYLKAAAQGIGERWGVLCGVDCEIESDLPVAAGLSSSSALVVGMSIALLRAAGIEPQFDELMEVLPEAEHFVGTRGGGMDHAACLAGQAGCALLVEFNPVRVRPVALPLEWGFFVAHSLRRAEKSAGLAQEYNLRRQLGVAGLARLRAGGAMSADEARCVKHVESESRRVHEAVAAIEAGDLRRFADLMSASHVSLRDDLRVSCSEADELVAASLRVGALGARIMGAGFGGYVLGVCRREERDEVMARLQTSYFDARPESAMEPARLLAVEPGVGALA